MIEPREIIGLIKVRVGRTLSVAEAALPPSQFNAFRKLMLDEFGRNGLETELFELLNQHRGPRNG